MLFKALDAKPGEAFARELAGQMLAQLGTASASGTRKFEGKAGKALKQAGQRIAAFKAGHALNWYQRSRCVNAFLWTLKDGGCDEAYAQELTQWFLAQW